ncbi:MAG: aldo/keto reductase [Myxococcales bacterium]|nr:aldo/keto reductase [Myxococcales bacterium]MCB9704095.1 aldo/keto reductase [Myxococcales bacterium]
MRHAFLGSTGVRVSRLALGTMSFGGSVDRGLAGELFARSREAGINVFDCADVYNAGAAETILGELIAECRDEVVICTKAYFPTGGDANARGLSRYHLVRAVEASLRRLATDRIDVFYLHRFDDVTDLEDVLRTLDDLVRQGKILYPAASNFAAWQVAKALGIAARRGFAPLTAIQPMYNLAKRQAEVELLPMAAAERLAVFPYSPLGGGLLSGKYGAERRPLTGRLLSNKMYQVRYGDPQNYAIAEAFTALAGELGVHPASLAIAWVGAHPAVTAPLLGVHSREQLEIALASQTIPMSAELYARIAALSPTPPPATDRNEETSEHNYGAR